MRSTSFLLALIHVLPARAQAGGQDPISVQRAETQARALLSEGKAEQAISQLKVQIERTPLRESLRLLLARAYLDDANDFWALRTLAAAAEIFPEDCNLTLWQAFVQLKLGELDQARALLDGACTAWSPDVVRRSLLLAMIEQRAGATAKAKAYLDEARQARLAYPEDRAAISQLRNQLEPGPTAPITGRLDLALGGTTNARAGSPLDPADLGNGANSPLVQASAWVRLVAPVRSWARPALEVEVHGLGYSAATGRDLSYLMFDSRPELILGRGDRRALVAYRYQSLLLASSDRYATGPLWFFDAHRAEWELELHSALTLFGGAGKRTFRETGRTRWEVDGGVGSGIAVASSLHLMGAAVGRLHDASNPAYDLRGASLLLSAEVRLPRRWSLRAGAFASGDVYPRSVGYFDPAAPSTARRDLLLRLSASMFAPPVGDGIKLGLTYEFATRDSSAQPYAYTDHRLLAKLIWSFSADPLLPHAASPVGHVAIDYGLGSQEIPERIQDLLRQDEAAQRSSSCRE